jgi:hypothetical protein
MAKLKILKFKYENEKKQKWSILTIRDAMDIRLDKPALFYIRYPAGYRISLPDIR